MILSGYSRSKNQRIVMIVVTVGSGNVNMIIIAARINSGMYLCSM
jgi:uncharacterized protein YodC (DUF2158 family)